MKKARWSSKKAKLLSNDLHDAGEGPAAKFRKSFPRQKFGGDWDLLSIHGTGGSVDGWQIQL